MKRGFFGLLILLSISFAQFDPQAEVQKVTQVGARLVTFPIFLVAVGSTITLIVYTFIVLKKSIDDAKREGY